MMLETSAPVPAPHIYKNITTLRIGKDPGTTPISKINSW